MNRQKYYAIIAGQDRSVPAHLARLGLSVAAGLYAPIITLRNAMFGLGIRRSSHLGRAAISVGNLTAGGTGKTPVVLDIARRLLAKGHRPAVLLRGYHAQDGLSDEASLLADALAPDAPVIAHPLRTHAAACALANNPAIDCFILDDAFQHRQAQRDLDLVLIDATNPFGHGRLLPRGLLREPVRGLARAQGVIITRCDLVTPEELAVIEKEVERLTGQPPLALAAMVWEGYLDAGNVAYPLGHLAGKSVMGVCGVGNPKAFERMLVTQLGPQPVVSMGDHHRYRQDDLAELFLMATRQGAQALVTTEKDWVKWRQYTPVAGWPLPVYRPALGVRWLRGAQGLDEALEQFISAR